jgi:hypothetical protein
VSESGEPVIYADGVLAGAYRGKDIAGRTLLMHAVSDRRIQIGRLKREPGEAFCDRNLQVAGCYEAGDKIDCPRCLEIVRRATR